MADGQDGRAESILQAAADFPREMFVGTQTFLFYYIPELSSFTSASQTKWIQTSQTELTGKG